MSATDGTSRKFVLLHRAFSVCASAMQMCRTRLARFTTSKRADATELQQSSAAVLVLQRLTRVRLPNGRVEIRGTVLAEFRAGDRQAAVYVGFCPPFEFLPIIEAKIGDNVEADLKLLQVLHSGAQFEIRLREPAEESVAFTVEFIASEVEQHGSLDARLTD
jgi:hypothetical protein